MAKTPSAGPKIPCPVCLASHREYALCALTYDSPWGGPGNTSAGVTSSEAVTGATLPGSISVVLWFSSRGRGSLLQWVAGKCMGQFWVVARIELTISRLNFLLCVG